jgi:hypothetical protein
MGSVKQEMLEESANEELNNEINGELSDDCNNDYYRVLRVGNKEEYVVQVYSDVDECWCYLCDRDKPKTFLFFHTRESVAAEIKRLCAIRNYYDYQAP